MSLTSLGKEQMWIEFMAASLPRGGEFGFGPQNPDYHYGTDVYQLLLKYAGVYDHGLLIEIALISEIPSGRRLELPRDETFNLVRRYLLEDIGEAVEI